MAALNRVNPVATEPRDLTAPDGDSPRKNNNFPEADYGDGYSYDPDFKGPVANRKCTDIICLLLFIGFLCGWGVVAFLAIQSGDIDRIIYPTDSKGQICGRGDLKERPVLLFFDLTKCLNPAVLAIGCPTTQVCVRECPKVQYSGFGHVNMPTAKLPFQDQQIKETMRPFCERMTQTQWQTLSASELIKQGICPAWVLPSAAVLGRCLPTLVNTENTNDNPNATVFRSDESPNGETIHQGTVSNAVNALGAFLAVRGFGEQVFNDLSETWWMIAAGLAAACVVSFFWIVLMRFVTGIMVWTSILMIFALFGGLFGFTLYKYIVIKDMPSAQGNIFQVNFTPNYGNDVLALANTWLFFSILSGLVVLIIAMILVALRQRILIAIELIEEGSKAVGQMCSTLFFPIVPFAIQCSVVFLFTVVALNLSSAGEAEYRIAYPVQPEEFTRSGLTDPCPGCTNPKTSEPYRLSDECNPDYFQDTCKCPSVECQFTKYIKPDGLSWMVWFNLFAFYWGMFFASALAELILAGVYATWYWTWDKKDVPFFVSIKFFGVAIFYHLGTVAFGSLIIAIIRFIRTILSYIESKLKHYDNDLVKCMLCACKCCLYCLEKFMRFINRNAYIVCAMKSTNFCVSAKNAFDLLMRNLLRVLVLNKVVGFLLFLGKLVIITGIGCLSYFVFSGGIAEIKDDIPSLNFFQAPIVVIVIGTYFITTCFFGVYSMAVDTLFLCFLEDLERNDGTPTRPYFMSRSLQKVIGKMNKIKTDRR